jgi:hypothetical protein
MLKAVWLDSSWLGDVSPAIHYFLNYTFGIELINSHLFNTKGFEVEISRWLVSAPAVLQLKR